MKNKFYLTIGMVAGYHQKLNQPDGVNIMHGPNDLLSFVNAALTHMQTRSRAFATVFRPKGKFILANSGGAKKFVMVAEDTNQEIPEKEAYFPYHASPKEFLEAVLEGLRRYDVNSRQGYCIIDTRKDSGKFAEWCRNNRVINTLELYMLKTPGLLDM